MKIAAVISSLALLASVVAVMMAARTSPGLSEAEVDARVDAVLTARERKLVQAYTPRFREMFMDMEGDGSYGASWAPETLEELFAPLTKVIGGMGEVSSDPAPAQTAPPDGSKR